MANPRHEMGLSAEEAVARWLEASAWELLARRYRSTSGGEVDLVMVDPAGVLVGIEVRARRSGRAGLPGETVDRRRVARIERSLAAFAASHRVRHRGLRVDVVAAVVERRGDVRALRLTRIRDVGG